MASSYRAINFSLRPAKTIERKMLCETFRRLHPFGKVDAYKYVGMGAIYFSDFLLFHRDLGIKDMLSIEKDEYAQDCFKFNKPYQCVDLDFRSTAAVLPELDLSKKTIVWLDYDGPMESDTLSDVGSVCSRIGSGGVLVVTVNAHPEGHPSEKTKEEYKTATGREFDMDSYRLWVLRTRLADNVPQEVEGRELHGKGIARISHRLIDAKIQETLAIRNGVLPPERKIQYQQIFNFHYSDGSKMLTVGGVFFEVSHRGLFDACSFDEVGFIRRGAEPYAIKVPCLTPKEMRHLNAQLPACEETEVTLPGVPLGDIQRYAELYRYFPTFTEAFFS